MKGLKYILLIVFLSAFSLTSTAQVKVKNLPYFDYEKFNWGYFLGASMMDYKFTGNNDILSPVNIDTLGIEVKSGIGFNAGLILNFRLNEYFYLRFEPGVNYTSRSIDLKYAENIVGGLDAGTIRKIQNAYVDIPVYLKYSGKRRRNFNPYLIAGPKFSYDMLSKAESFKDNTNGEFRTKPFNIFIDFGIGIDWYLPYFRWTTELKASFAMLDELVRDGSPPGSIISGYTDPISKMNSRGLFLVMKFE